MSPKQPSGAGSPPPSILAVDDTPANLQVLAGMLKERGYKVRPVPSGKLALQAARHDPPDLILLDINMPEMNGYEIRACNSPQIVDVALGDRGCKPLTGVDVTSAIATTYVDRSGG